MKKPVSKNIIQELEMQKRAYNAKGEYVKAKDIQNKLDFYYWGRK
jgi:hypothetical protein